MLLSDTGSATAGGAAAALVLATSEFLATSRRPEPGAVERSQASTALSAQLGIHFAPPIPDRAWAPKRVRMRRVPDVTKDTLTDFVLDHVARGSEVRTDGWQGYFDIGRYRFDDVVTNVSASGDPAHVPANRTCISSPRW